MDHVEEWEETARRRPHCTVSGSSHNLQGSEPERVCDHHTTPDGIRTINTHLARISCTDSPLCSKCQVPEPVSHYLFTCRLPVYADTRRLGALQTSLKNKPFTLRSTLGKGTRHDLVLRYIRTTLFPPVPGHRDTMNPAFSIPRFFSLSRSKEGHCVQVPELREPEPDSECRQFESSARFLLLV